jgi:hypothetical protein
VGKLAIRVPKRNTVVASKGNHIMKKLIAISVLALAGLGFGASVLLTEETALAQSSTAQQQQCQREAAQLQAQLAQCHTDACRQQVQAAITAHNARCK